MSRGSFGLLQCLPVIRASSSPSPPSSLLKWIVDNYFGGWYNTIIMGLAVTATVILMFFCLLWCSCTRLSELKTFPPPWLLLSYFGSIVRSITDTYTNTNSLSTLSPPLYRLLIQPTPSLIWSQFLSPCSFCILSLICISPLHFSIEFLPCISYLNC